MMAETREEKQAGGDRVYSTWDEGTKEPSGKTQYLFLKRTLSLRSRQKNVIYTDGRTF